MKKIWCFWADPKNITQNRIDSFNTLCKYSNVDLEMVTTDTMSNYKVANHPIHEAFYYLSDTDKSDYARCYLTHHYGGGYTDIKPFKMNWEPYFDYLNDENIDLIGPQEPGSWAIANPECLHLHNKLVSVNKFILRKYSHISTEWYDEMNNTLNKKLQALKENPGWYHPRAVVKTTCPSGVFDSDESQVYDINYPLNWAEICGLIFHKVQSKYIDRISTTMQSEFFHQSQYR